MSKCYRDTGFRGLLRLISKIDENIAIQMEYDRGKYIFGAVDEENNTLITASGKLAARCCDEIIDFLTKKYNIYTY